jgi:hypothetical protein
MQNTAQWKVGDRVRHEKRPEWGIGTVQRAEFVQVGDKPSQRLVVRFPNAGVKTLSTLGAELSIAEPVAASPGTAAADGATLVDREGGREAGWLGSISKARPEDAMIELPLEATDPFRTLKARLQHTLGLYRFQRDGASLIDWAVARSGLDDPLSRFTRPELEQYFERWAQMRERHLLRLTDEARREPGLLESLLPGAPRAAVAAVSRGNPVR